MVQQKERLIQGCHIGLRHFKTDQGKAEWGLSAMQQIIGSVNASESAQITPVKYVLRSTIGRLLACTALTIGVALTSQSGGTVTMPSLTVTGVIKKCQPIRTTLLTGLS